MTLKLYLISLYFVDQLRYNGILEAVNVSRKDFSIRINHLEYHQRYQVFPDYDQFKDGVIKGYTKYFIKNIFYILSTPFH